jgi:hypothetical protein
MPTRGVLKEAVRVESASPPSTNLDQQRKLAKNPRRLRFVAGLPKRDIAEFGDDLSLGLCPGAPA